MSHSPTCSLCGERLGPGQRTFCSDMCRDVFMEVFGFPGNRRRDLQYDPTADPADEGGRAPSHSDRLVAFQPNDTWHHGVVR